MKSWGVPGLAVAIVKDGKVVLAKGYGLRNVQANLPVTADTLFAIGSSTKAFTTMSMGILVEEGKLAWDEPVTKYLPTFELKDKVAGTGMTPRDLVTHRSGLPRHDLVWYNAKRSRAELVAATEVPRAEREFSRKIPVPESDVSDRRPSGGRGRGRVVGRGDKNADPRPSRNEEHATLRSVCRRKGATSRRPTRSKRRLPGDIPFRVIDTVGPAGSINSSVNDMAKWLQLNLGVGAIDGKRIVAARQVQDMHRPQMVIQTFPGLFEDPEIQQPAYGLGWFVESYRGKKRVHHGGAIDGFMAQVSFLPSEGVGVVVLTNLGGTPLPDIVARHASDRLMGLEPIDWNGRALKRRDVAEKASAAAKKSAGDERKAGTKPAHALDEYAGEYAHPAYGSVIVAVSGDSLVRPLPRHADAAEPLALRNVPRRSGREVARRVEALLPVLHGRSRRGRSSDRPVRAFGGADRLQEAPTGPADRRGVPQTARRRLCDGGQPGVQDGGHAERIDPVAHAPRPGAARARTGARDDVQPERPERIQRAFRPGAGQADAVESHPAQRRVHADEGVQLSARLATRRDVLTALATAGIAAVGAPLDQPRALSLVRRERPRVLDPRRRPGSPGHRHRHAQPADAGLPKVRPLDVRPGRLQARRPHAVPDVRHQRLPHRRRHRRCQCPSADPQFMSAWNSFLANQDQAFMRIDSAADLDRVKTSGRIGVLLGVQNAEHFRTADDVDLFYALGQRVSQLTYNTRNLIGNGSTERRDEGLSDFGVSIVERMNKTGMAVDVSHCGDRTTLDAFEASQRPVLITHSNCRALVPGHPRCKTDEAIKKMASTGGVMGITGVRMFVRAEEPTTIEHYLDHIDHVVRLTSIEHVGVGSDIDLYGYDTMRPDENKRLRDGYKGSYGFREKIDIEGLNHPQRMFDLTEGLIRRKYSDRDIELILGGNFKRVLAEIWKRAQRRAHGERAALPQHQLVFDFRRLPGLDHRHRTASTLVSSLNEADVGDSSVIVATNLIFLPSIIASSLHVQTLPWTWPCTKKLSPRLDAT